MEPVSDEPFFSVTVSELELSATMLPARVCASAVRMAVPPFAPAVPQSPLAAFSNTPEFAVAATLFSVITPVELVT